MLTVLHRLMVICVIVHIGWLSKSRIWKSGYQVVRDSAWFMSGELWASTECMSYNRTQHSHSKCTPGRVHFSSLLKQATFESVHVAFLNVGTEYIRKKRNGLSSWDCSLMFVYSTFYALHPLQPTWYTTSDSRALGVLAIWLFCSHYLVNWMSGNS